MKRSTAFIALLALLAWSGVLNAHEVRPAYLKIQQLDETQFETVWRVPARGELRLGLYVEMPAHCTSTGDSLSWTDGTTYSDRVNYQCPGGLAGFEVRISGLESMMTDALARFERLDGTTQVARLTPAQPAFVVTAAEDWRQVVSTYFKLGVEPLPGTRMTITERAYTAPIWYTP